MASVNQTRPHCVNQMGKTHSKPLAARHGRGTAWQRNSMGAAWEWHAMRESAFIVLHMVSPDVQSTRLISVPEKLPREHGATIRVLF